MNLHDYRYMRTKTGVQVLGFVVLVAAPTIAGCGGSGGSCGVTPCGGDVVASWQANSSCVNRAVLTEEFKAQFAESCPDVSLGNVTVTPTGSINFVADMTYSGSMALMTSVVMNFPGSCLGGTDCATLNTALQGVIGMSGIVSVNCTGSGSCACTMVQSVTNLLPSPGTYTTAANEITLTGADATVEMGPYCVKGSDLHLVDVEMGGMMRIESDIVFKKQ